MEPKVSKPALRFGDLVHQALAVYYPPGKKRGPHPAKTYKKLYIAETKKSNKFGIRDEDNEWMEAGELGEEILENYVDTYGRDSSIYIIHPEHPVSVVLRDASGHKIRYVMRFDALARIEGEVGLLEHKTAKSINEEPLALDEQGGSYWAFAPGYLRKKGILKAGRNLDMILYNFLRKARPDPRPRDRKGRYLNKDGSVSKTQPPPYFERVSVYRDDADRRQVLRRIRLESWEMRMVREGKLPIYKNPTKTCHYDCPFYHICELHETGSDWREVARQNFNVVDPYAEYREDLGLPAVSVGRRS